MVCNWVSIDYTENHDDTVTEKHRRTPEKITLTCKRLEGWRQEKTLHRTSQHIQLR